MSSRDEAPRLIHRYVFTGTKLTANGRKFRKAGQRAHVEIGSDDDLYYRSQPKLFDGPFTVVPGREATDETKIYAERARRKAENERQAIVQKQLEAERRAEEAEAKTAASEEAAMEAEAAKLRVEREAEAERKAAAERAEELKRRIAELEADLKPKPRRRRKPATKKPAAKKTAKKTETK